MPHTHPSGPLRLELTQGQITSQGAGAEELVANLNAARADERFIPLLANADMLPENFRGLRILPAVTYGVTSRRMNAGAVEVLPGTEQMIAETYASDYFNPHIALRARARNLMDSAKHNRQAKVTRFTLPSYVIGGGDTRHLFIGGDQSDLETLSPDYAKALSEAYQTGSVVLGSLVIVGKIKVDFGKTSLPSLVREIGQTIGTTKGLSASDRASMLEEAKKKLSRNTSPDYRPWLARRS